MKIQPCSGPAIFLAREELLFWSGLVSTLHFKRTKMCVKVQSQQSRSVEPGQSHLPTQYRGLVTRPRPHSTEHCLPAHLPFTGKCVNSTDIQHECSPIPDTQASPPTNGMSTLSLNPTPSEACYGAARGSTVHSGPQKEFKC